MNPPRSQIDRGLVRGLGLFDGTMLVAGSMIGSGIFIVSADMARLLGSPVWVLGVWVLTGGLTLVAALSYGELAAMMPRAGGQYVYLREAYGPIWGFLYGWTLFLVIQTGTVAAVAMAFAKFLGVLMPWVGENRTWVALGRFSVGPMSLVAVAVLVLLTWTNARGLAAGKSVQNLLTVVKIASLLGLIGAGLWWGWGTPSWGENWRNFGTAPHSIGSDLPLSGRALGLAVAAAMVGSLFSSDAWNNVTFTAGEMKRPQRNVPLSLALGVALVSVLYLCANLSFLALLPLSGTAEGGSVLDRGIQFATNDRVGTAAAEVMLGGAGASAMAVLILISTFGCINGMILAGARVYFAMARDGLFFEGVGRLNRSDVPGNGLWVQCAWACALTFSGTYGDLLDYVIFAVLVFYVGTIGGVYVLRFRRPDAERPYRAWGYPWLPGLYMVVASMIAVGLLVAPETRNNAWPGLLLVFAGVPVYYVWRGCRRLGNRES